MLDLVKQETERIESRFLEPACGNGNFLAEVLQRKLNIVTSRYKKHQRDFERYAILAVSSIYGIDLLLDNVEECRSRLYGIFEKYYTTLFKRDCREDFQRSIKFVLSRNIIHGDALTLKQEGLVDDPIIFSEWSLVYRDQIKRRDYTMETLLSNQPIEEPNLFSDLGEEAFIPTPCKKYPLQSIYNLAEDVQNKL
ncbi:MAG: SAM-dependent DNA methyltransferase [Bacteroidota bacterium]